MNYTNPHLLLYRREVVFLKKELICAYRIIYRIEKKYNCLLEKKGCKNKVILMN